MENNEKTEPTEAPAEVEFDNEVIERMMAQVTERVLEQKAPVAERKDPVLETSKDEPKVTGERVPQWQRRAFRKMHAIGASESTEHERRKAGFTALMEDERQVRSITAWQRDEEEAEVAATIANSGLSARAQKRLHSTLTGPAGEFLLPKPFLAELFVFIETYGHARRLARIVPMGSKDLDLKNIASKPTAAWTGEAVLLTESDLAVGEQKLTTHKLGAVTSITSEQDEDAFVALLPTWLELVAESIAQKEDQAWMIGDGTSTYGGFVGLANLASVQQNVLGSSDLKFGDVVEGDFRTTKNQLSTVRQKGARWLMHRGMWDVVEQFEATGAGRIVQPMLTAEAPLRLLGFPVELTEAMTDATADVANVDFAILGNYSRSLMGIRRGITVETSTDAVLSNSSGVVTFNAFQQDGMLLKISTRVGFQTPTAMQDGFAVMTAPGS